MAKLPAWDALRQRGFQEGVDVAVEDTALRWK
jgi:hypothetical protein